LVKTSNDSTGSAQREGVGASLGHGSHRASGSHEIEWIEANLVVPARPGDVHCVLPSCGCKQYCKVASLSGWLPWFSPETKPVIF